MDIKNLTIFQGAVAAILLFSHWPHVFAQKNPPGAALLTPPDLPLILKKHEIILYNDTEIQENLIFTPKNHNKEFNDTENTNKTSHVFALETPTFAHEQQFDYSSTTTLYLVTANGKSIPFEARHIYLLDEKDITNELKCLGPENPNSIEKNLITSVGLFDTKCIDGLIKSGYIIETEKRLEIRWKSKIKYVFQIETSEAESLLLALSYQTRIQFEPQWSNTGPQKDNQILFGDVCPEKASRIKLKAGHMNGVKAWHLSLYRRKEDLTIPANVRWLNPKQNIVSCEKVKKDSFSHYTIWQPKTAGWSNTVFAEDGFN